MKLISTNPSQNYAVLGEVTVSSESEVRGAVVKAHQALPLWSDLPLKKRIEYINSYLTIAKNRSEEIAQLIAAETGRPIVSARDNVLGGIKYFDAYISMVEKSLAPKVTFESATQIHRIYREPRGVIAVICPWNYPFMNVTWQTGQALLAGNTIVYKNSEENPLFAKLLEEIINQSAIPKGVFTIIYGDGQTGQQLLAQDIDMISFTGSSKIGQALNKVAAEKFIPIVTELGGSSPLVLFEDVEITDAVIAFIFERRFKNAGQACDAVKRLIVHENKFDEIVEKLRNFIAIQKIGNALDEETIIGPLVAERQVKIIEEQVRDAVEKGAKIEIGGKQPSELLGAYYEPTLLTNINSEMRVWREETFGPVLPIVSFKTEEEATRLANDTEYGLTAHVITKDKALFQRVAKQLNAGSVGHNMVGFWSPENPFGGYKKSGMGRVHGEEGFHDVTQIKVVSEEKL